MTDTEIRQVQKTARELAETVLRPRAAEIDATRQYPAENLAALAKAGLMGLLVPPAYGGVGGTLMDFALVCEELARGCASTAMCYLMHGCGCAVIAARATPEQGERWLRPAAAGKALATLAFSERGSGAHFYNPEITAQRQNGSFLLSGKKSFVTSGSHAAIYPVLVNASGQPGLDVLVVTSDLPGLSFEGAWEGIGMAGNSSIVMSLDNVAVPAGNIVGVEGDGQALVFEVVAPTFLLGLSGVAVGIAQAALEAATEHTATRRHADGKALAEAQAIQFYIAEMSIETVSARALVALAAAAADSGDPGAVLPVMQAKVKATNAAQTVTDIAMQVGGGQAYSRRLPIERHWRDARAGSVMAPTNEVLKEWIGKSLAGLPLF